MEKAKIRRKKKTIKMEKAKIGRKNKQPNQTIKKIHTEVLEYVL